MKKQIILALCFVPLITGCTPLREVRFDTMENTYRARLNAITKTGGKKTYQNKELSGIKNLSTQVVNFDKQMENQKERIRFLEANVKNMESIENASIAIMETAAIVSINFTEGLTNERVLYLKKNIENKIKELDTSIKYVSVTTAPELIERINSKGQNLENEKLQLTKSQKEIIKNFSPII